MTAITRIITLTRIAIALLILAAFAPQSIHAQRGGAVVEPQTRAEIAELIGLPVWSSDGKEIGLVVAASSGIDGKVQSIDVAVGSFLGFGERTVMVTADKFQNLGERVLLALTVQEVQSLPDAQRGA